MEPETFFNSDFFTFIAVVAIICIAAIWRIFEKAGKPGWASLIPIYNILMLLEIIGKPWWWLLLMAFVPVANIIFAIWTINLLSKSFGKSEGFTVGLIFLGFIFYPILGFGNAEYKGPAGAPAGTEQL
ncbi:MAG TPA: DUF5684 domain-containing protein [Bacteroidales bacterium]